MSKTQKMSYNEYIPVFIVNSDVIVMFLLLQELRQGKNQSKLTNPSVHTAILLKQNY